MKYNIIGDIHCRDNWKKLVREDCVNIFVGDYFSPYFPYPFEDQVSNFMDIIMYKTNHPETVLLLGNHDEDHWHIHERYSRFDSEHFETIRELFEENKDYFQIAYSIEDKILVTHAGVSVVWYVRQKYNIPFTNIITCNYDEDDEVYDLYTGDKIKVENPVKYSLSKSIEETWKMFTDRHYTYTGVQPIDREPRNGQIVIWNKITWCYVNHEWIKLEVTPNQVAEFINSLWLSGNYRAFNFNNNCGPNDYYGDDERHGPLWIRPSALSYSNIFQNTPYYQVVGHTRPQSKTIDRNTKNVMFVDVLGWTTESLIVDTNNISFDINHEK